ncbi:MAG: hypothetical protein ACK5Q5_01810 [Planctomycetaceae bacterium]
MRRAMLTAGLLLATLTGNSPAFDDFYYDDYGWDDGYNDYGWDNNWGGGGRRRGGSASPYNPGVQNNSGWDNNWDYGYNNGWNNYNNGWNNNYYQPQQNWNYQPAKPAVVYSQQPIKIAMPENEAGLCAYVLKDNSNSWNYTIAPGKSQEFKEDRGWKITFDRGNGHGEQTYGLKPGLYRFRQSSRGWELYHSAATTTAPVAAAPPPPM